VAVAAIPKILKVELLFNRLRIFRKRSLFFFLYLWERFL